MTENAAELIWFHGKIYGYGGGVMQNVRVEGRTADEVADKLVSEWESDLVVGDIAVWPYDYSKAPGRGVYRKIRDSHGHKLREVLKL